MCLTTSQTGALAKRAADKKRDLHAGPNDPEQSKIAAGVGILTAKALGMYEIQHPTKDYADAVSTGRCIIGCVDINGTTFACASIYGWAGAKPGNEAAARTNDLINIVLLQFAEMRLGPRAICGDINGPIHAFPAIAEMLHNGEWTDVGSDAKLCH